MSGFGREAEAHQLYENAGLPRPGFASSNRSSVCQALSSANAPLAAFAVNDDNCLGKEMPYPRRYKRVVAVAVLNVICASFLRSSSNGIEAGDDEELRADREEQFLTCGPCRDEPPRDE